MILGPKIDVWNERGRVCKIPSCPREVSHRMTVPTKQRHDHYAAASRALFYCPDHAAKWAKAHGMTLPEEVNG